jgi:hypothetical protein
MDKDHDNRLGDNDFSASVREDPLLLSCFGQVFANAKVCITIIMNIVYCCCRFLQIVEAFCYFFSEYPSID